MSARDTATENLDRWLEFQLKPYSRIHEAHIKDTKSFLLHLEHLNQTRVLSKTEPNSSAGILSTTIQTAVQNCV